MKGALMPGMILKRHLNPRLLQKMCLQILTRHSTLMRKPEL
jgi:hypothetical protein